MNGKIAVFASKCLNDLNQLLRNLDGVSGVEILNGDVVYLELVFEDVSRIKVLGVGQTLSLEYLKGHIPR